MKESIKKVPVIITAAVAAILLITLLFSITFVGAGHTGVVSTFGKVSSDVLEEGFHFKLPWQKVIEIDNRIVKLEVKTEAFSKDLQSVKTCLAINYRVNSTKSYSIYKNIGADYEKVLITPAVNEVLKAITSTYTAEQSVTNRILISEGLIKGLNEKLNKSGLFVTDVNIIDFDFSDAFISAIEDKQVAQQKLLKAETDKKTKIINAQAKAEAEIAEAKGKAKANQLINKSISDKVLENKKIEKWDGKLPQVSGGATPIIQIPKD